MVIIKPFRATILNPEIPDREKLICPVYDTIDERGYERYGREKNNVIHLTTRKNGTLSSEFIENAKRQLDRFFTEEILVERDHPAFYIYGIRYSLPEHMLDLIPHAAKRDVYFAFGLIALVKVVGPGEIVGHEKIFEKHSAERTELMRLCGMNFAPIASEYSMPGHEINNIFEKYLGFKRPDLVIRDERPPLLDISLNGSRHLLWEITDHDTIEHIRKLMADKKILILDGHHRFHAARSLALRDGVEYTMMMFMEGGDRALLLLPWHRCIRQLDEAALQVQMKRYFDLIWKDRHDETRFYELLNTRDGANDVRIGMYDQNGFSVYRAHRDNVNKLSDMLNERVGLDFISLNEWIIRPCVAGNEVDAVSFCDSVGEAIRRVNDQGFRAAFLMRPLNIEDVEYKAHIEKKNFPQKSTLFLPKVAEGILMRNFRVRE